MVKSFDRTFEFDGMRIDVANRRLIRDGSVIRLTPKAFDLLLLLVENHGRLIEREAIMQSLWPDTSVEETNLTQTIYLLRRALGEDSSGNSYIETLPKSGYRFTADVRVTPARDEPAAHSDRTDFENRNAGGADSIPTSAAIRRPRRWLVAVALLVFGLACLGWLIQRSYRSQKPMNDVGIKSVAVLPFRPIHMGSNDQYLGLGMADALITRLSSLRSIVVRPTDAIRRYDGVDRDSVEVGRELGVEGVLTGSVQRLGGRLRVTVQMIQIKDGASLWSDQFDEKFTDVFALEDSISRHVTSALTIRMSREESRRLVRHGTDDPAAFDLYLKGRYYWGQKTPGSIQKSIESFQQAIDLDRSYALAYSGLADSYAVAASGLRPGERFPKARDAASRAVSLDDALAEAHASIGYILYKFYWEWSNAEHEFKRAIELNPNDSTAHHYYGEYLCLTGRFDEGLVELKQARNWIRFRRQSGQTSESLFTVRAVTPRPWNN
jgi:DNA-binding winged helix-turn-helix (wHTH) protein/TolB-like protein